MLEGTGRNIRQASLRVSCQVGRLVAIESADGDAQAFDLHAMRKSLLFSCATWPYDLQQRACPYPIVVPRYRLTQLEHLHRLLASAILSIVERWWTDEEARFWERMPIEKREEDVLRVAILSFEPRS